MNKKGFTLVEVIGVLTLLSIVVLVAFPNILGAMNKTEEQMDKATTELLISNAKSYFSENVIMVGGTSYCVKVSTLISQNYTKTPISTVDSTDAADLEANYSVLASPNGYIKQGADETRIYKWSYSLTNSPGMTCD